MCCAAAPTLGSPPASFARGCRETGSDLLQTMARNIGVLLGIVPLHDDLLTHVPDMALNEGELAQLHPIADLRGFVVVRVPCPLHVRLYSKRGKELIMPPHQLYGYVEGLQQGPKGAQRLGITPAQYRHQAGYRGPRGAIVWSGQVA
jgi:hypothetical protein